MRIFDHDATLGVTTNDRWTPVLRGDIYCSPACGADCKKADYDRVTEVAKQVAARLGPGWTPCVKENLGWFYEVHKGSAVVCPISSGGFSATIRFDIDGHQEGLLSAENDDPRAAMQTVLEKLEARITRMKYAMSSAALMPLEIEQRK